jgi:AGZA family xanthine/uracil permease-like MFS transporter
VRLATPAAIGFFLAHLGLQTAEGIGVVVSDVATAVTLGACPPEDRTPLVAFTPSCQADPMACVIADSYTCDEVKGSKMTSARTWLGLFGMAVMAIMIAYKNRSAFICGIGFVTFISWFRDTSVTYFPNTEDGDARFDYFKQVVRVEPLENLLANYTR